MWDDHPSQNLPSSFVSNPSSKSIAGHIAVISAIIGNTIITFLKCIGFFVSGSPSLFSETIHSFADTMNQVLLMIGIKKSQRKQDDKFVYGYKKERYFRATISACGIFFIGAGITIFHGLETLLDPHPAENITWILSILVVSFFVESLTLYIALRSIYDGEIWLKKSLSKADNASLAVILEDSIAVLWVLIAFVCIAFASWSGLWFIDGIGSIVIGVMLGMVAVFLIIQNKSYLIGKTIDIDTKEEIIDFLESSEFIEKVIDFKSEILDDHNYIIKCEIEFNGAALTKELNANGIFEKEYEDVKEDYTEFLKFCSYYANLVPRVMGQKINIIEKDIRKEFPSVKYIDMEIN